MNFKQSLKRNPKDAQALLAACLYVVVVLGLSRFAGAIFGLPTDFRWEYVTKDIWFLVALTGFLIMYADWIRAKQKITLLGALVSAQAAVLVIWTRLISTGVIAIPENGMLMTGTFRGVLLVGFIFGFYFFECKLFGIKTRFLERKARQHR